MATWIDPKTKRELEVDDREVVRQRILRNQGWQPKQSKAAAPKPAEKPVEKPAEKK